MEWDRRRLSDGIYRALLVAYPEEFRREYEDEMVQDFRDLRLERLRSPGGRGIAALWLWALFDLLKGATMERSRMFGAVSVPLRASGVAALVGGALLLAATFLGMLFGTTGSPGEAPGSQSQLAWGTFVGARLALIFMLLSLYLHIRRYVFRIWGVLATSGAAFGVVSALFAFVAVCRASAIGGAQVEPGYFYKNVVEPVAVWGMTLSFVLVGLATLRVATSAWRWMPLVVGFLLSPVPFFMAGGLFVRIRSEDGAVGYVPFYVVDIVPTFLAALACLALGYAMISGGLVRHSREARIG